MQNVDVYQFFNILKLSKIVLLLLFITSCGQDKEQQNKYQDKFELTNEYDTLQALYYGFVDTLIRYPNEVYIVNSKFDSVIYEYGIFTFLKYDFELSTPKELISEIRQARSFEEKGKTQLAQEKYLQIIGRFKIFENEEYKGDMNGYLEFKINSSILYSYAFEKLNNLDKSIEILTPFLANSEVFGTKIQERFISLCIKKYGIKSVKEEIDKSSSTIRKIHSPISYDIWVVNIFDAKIGIDNGINTDSVTINEAVKIIEKMNFYYLVN